MPVQRQLSIFLENKPGILARVCQSLAKAKINIIALSVSDTVDHAVVRLIVSDPTKARDLLEQRGVLVVETDVLSLRIPNEPGALGQVSRALSKARINIEYAYGTAGGQKSESQFILRVDKLAKARKILKV